MMMRRSIVEFHRHGWGCPEDISSDAFWLWPRHPAIVTLVMVLMASPAEIDAVGRVIDVGILGIDSDGILDLA
jgi:hypothetical protein